MIKFLLLLPLLTSPAYATTCMSENWLGTRSHIMSWVDFPSAEVARATISSLVMSSAHNSVYVKDRKYNVIQAETILRCFDVKGQIILYEVYTVKTNCNRVSTWDGAWKCDTDEGLRLEVVDLLKSINQQ